MDLLGGPPAVVGPPRLGPYYQLAFRPVGEIPNVDTFYVPGAAMVCTGRGCFALATRLVPALDAAAAQVTAYRPVISSVTVDGTPRSRPAAYASALQREAGPRAAEPDLEDPRLLDRAPVLAHHAVVARLDERHDVLPALPGRDARGRVVARERRARPANSLAPGGGTRRRPAEGTGGGRSPQRPSLRSRLRPAPGRGCGGRGPPDPWPGTTMPSSATTNVTSTPCFGPTTPRSCATWRSGSAPATTPPTSRRRSSWRPGAASPGCGTAAARCSRGSTGWRRTWRATG